jgi:hypothetical protein
MCTHMHYLAQVMCEKLKIKSSKDADKLKAAKEEVYLKGFYEGVLEVRMTNSHYTYFISSLNHAVTSLRALTIAIPSCILLEVYTYA